MRLCRSTAFFTWSSPRHLRVCDQYFLSYGIICPRGHCRGDHILWVLEYIIKFLDLYTERPIYAKYDPNCMIFKILHFCHQSLVSLARIFFDKSQIFLFSGEDRSKINALIFAKTACFYTYTRACPLRNSISICAGVSQWSVHTQ